VCYSDSSTLLLGPRAKASGLIVTSSLVSPVIVIGCRKSLMFGVQSLVFSTRQSKIAEMSLDDDLFILLLISIHLISICD
jgi:hypothetical protein